MPTPYLGEIKLISFKFAPKYWALCNGQLLPINQNQALFSLFGTSYGGDGINTFALPNLQSRTIVHQGQGNGLSNYTVGQQFGTNGVVLDGTQIPAHNHLLNVSGNGASAPSPIGAYPAVAPSTVGNLDGTAPTGLMPGAILPNAGGQPHENRQPFLTLNYIVCLNGIYPPHS